MAQNGLTVEQIVSLGLMMERLSNDPALKVDEEGICLLISCLKSTQVAQRIVNGLPEDDATRIAKIVLELYMEYRYFVSELFWEYIFRNFNASQIGQFFIMSVLPDYRNVDSTIITRVGLLLARAFATSQKSMVAPSRMPTSPDNDINSIFKTIRAKPAFKIMPRPLRMFGFPKRDDITRANRIEPVTDYRDIRGQGNALVSNSKSLSPRLASTSNPEHVAINIGHEDDHVPKKAFGFDTTSGNTKAAFSSAREIVAVAAGVPLISVAFDNIREYPERYPTNSGYQVRVTGFCFLTMNILMFLVSIYIVMAFAWSKLSQGGPKAFYVKSILSVVMGLACLIFALMVYRCLF